MITAWEARKMTDSYTTPALDAVFAQITEAAQQGKEYILLDTAPWNTPVDWVRPAQVLINLGYRVDFISGVQPPYINCQTRVEW